MSKTVLITGGAKGIGRATAIMFAKQGYHVVVNYHHSQKQAMELVEELKEYSIITVQADVSKEVQVRELIEQTITNFGTIDVLVNNAGVALPEKLLTQVNEQEFDHIYQMNVKSVFHCCQQVIPYMIRNNGGKIINVSSIYGISGESCEVVYSATKAAIIGFTQGLAKEVASSHITVNAVAPGCIDTDMISYLKEQERKELAKMTPLGYIGKPEDIAATICFLASKQADFITGQVISPNGGILI